MGLNPHASFTWTPWSYILLIPINPLSFKQITLVLERTLTEGQSHNIQCHFLTIRSTYSRALACILLSNNALHPAKHRLERSRHRAWAQLPSGVLKKNLTDLGSCCDLQQINVCYDETRGCSRWMNWSRPVAGSGGKRGTEISILATHMSGKSLIDSRLDYDVRQFSWECYFPSVDEEYGDNSDLRLLRATPPSWVGAQSSQAERLILSIIRLRGGATCYEDQRTLLQANYCSTPSPHFQKS